MKYACVDIETTGLDPDTCQILEVGVVLDDLSRQEALEKLPVFHAYVVHEQVRGEYFALSMHAAILARIGNREDGYSYLRPNEVGDAMLRFLNENGIRASADDSVVAAGKNFGGFDLQFLRRLPDFRVCFKHRSLDPAPYHTKVGDSAPPSLQVCLDRAGVKSTVRHDAVDDALLTILALRAGWNSFVKSSGA